MLSHSHDAANGLIKLMSTGGEVQTSKTMSSHEHIITISNSCYTSCLHFENV